MTLHIIKLSVGSESVEDLQTWIDARVAERLRDGGEEVHIHTTRMFPRRRDEVLDGGSIYWVIKGMIQCRQRVVDLRPVRGGDGIERCQLVMAPPLIATEWVPRRPFQGWRYLQPADAPPDAPQGAERALPPELKRELVTLGLM